MHRQGLAAKKGEVEFRRRLVLHQTGDSPQLADEYDAAGITEVLRERMRITRQRMAALRERGVSLSPYLEIGAERCQRSLVLENEFDARGAAADLSFEMLGSCERYQQVFAMSRAPLRVCCDIEALPFASGSLPFVFCYQTLHHFPDPSPAVREVHRVLAPAGAFYFDEEPYRKIAHLPLYQRKAYAAGTLARGRLGRALDFLFAEEVNNETGFGIVENDDIPVGLWKRALALFAEKDVEIRTVRNISSDLFRPPSRASYALAVLLGGTISGLCRKDAASPGRAVADIREALACPDCLPQGRQSTLTSGDGAFACGTCGSDFPVVSGVAFLLPRASRRELYPSAFAEKSGG